MLDHFFASLLQYLKAACGLIDSGRQPAFSPGPEKFNLPVSINYISGSMPKLAGSGLQSTAARGRLP